MPILICSAVNVEYSIQVEGFPVPYVSDKAARGALHLSIGGTGGNVASGLAALGREVRLLSPIAPDLGGLTVRAALAQRGISDAWLSQTLEETALSAVLIDGEGHRAIIYDPKAIWEQEIPVELFGRALEGSCGVIFGLNAFGLPLVARAQASGLPIYTDLQTRTAPDGPAASVLLRAATVVFASAEELEGPPADWLAAALSFPQVQVAVLSMGAEGALLATLEGPPLHLPAVATRPVVSTLGAGDALFSSFAHHHLLGMAPAEALRRAMTFASYKIGAPGAAEGFPSPAELERWCAQRP